MHKVIGTVTGRRCGREVLPAGCGRERGSVRNPNPNHSPTSHLRPASTSGNMGNTASGGGLSHDRGRQQTLKRKGTYLQSSCLSCPEC